MGPPGFGVGKFLSCPNVPRLIARAISEKMATLHEMQTVYSLQDVYDLLEVAAVDNYNARVSRADNH